MVAWYFPIKSVIKFKILWVKFLQTFFDFHLQSNFVIFGMGVIFPCRSNIFRTYYMARAYSNLAVVVIYQKNCTNPPIGFMHHVQGRVQTNLGFSNGNRVPNCEI